MLKDENTEAQNFDQLNIKVTQLHNNLKEDYCKKSYMQEYVDKKMLELQKKFEVSLTKTKKELEGQIKDSTKTILTKVSILERRIGDEAAETKTTLKRIADKFKDDFDYANDQIK